MFYQPNLFEPPVSVADKLGMPELIERIAAHSRRPRYAFMVLNLIAKAAGEGKSAGPYVDDGSGRVPLRDWLCDALVPMAQRNTRRRAIVEEVLANLQRRNELPADPKAAEQLLDEEVRARVRKSGRCNVSRAVSDLVRAGFLHRHYQGYRVDHSNRGAQREAVYTITDEAALALGCSG